MSDHVDDEEAQIRIYGLQMGVVTNNEDPEGLGRIRARIPAIHEPEGPWAFPLGTVGGGSAQQGMHFVPKIGANVGIFFQQGDPDHPFYLAGPPGAPAETGRDTPTPVKDLSPTDTPLVAAIEFGRYFILIDDREGKRGLLIKDKITEDKLEHDGEQGSWMMSGASQVILHSSGSVVIDAPMIVINGRAVGPGPQQI